MVSTATFLDAATEILGEGNARPGSDADAVDGLVPAFIAAPDSSDEASRLLALASRNGCSVLVRGGASKLGWGAPLERLDLVIETRRLTSLFEHEHGDLVLHVSAGWPLATLHERLAGSGQRLCLDPIGEGATLGGVFATADSGPLRLRYGTPRDLVIGVTVVLADGTVAKAGGRVVKNVAGYDLTKLYCGSFGTLGLVTELIVRLHPSPAESALLSLELDPDRIGAVVRAVTRHAAALPACCELEWAWGEERPRCTLRLEGAGAALGSQVAAGTRLLSGFGEVTELAGTTERLVGSTSAAGAVGTGPSPPLPRGTVRQPGGRPVTMRCRLSVPPALLEAELGELRRLAGGLGVACSLAGRAANAVLDATCTAADEDALSELVGAVRRRLGGHSGSAASGSLVVRDGPLGLRRRLDVWGPLAPGTLALMREVKQRFDPAAVLAPGRFVGGI